MTRERLPDRRETETFEVVHRTHDGVEQAFIVSMGRFPDGRLGEVFIEVPYQQQRFVTALMAKDVATLLSIALQHGATVEELQAAAGHSEVNEMGRAVDRPHTLIGTVLGALARKVRV